MTFFKKGVLALIVLQGLSCNKKEIFDGPNFYQDGFETYEKKDDLLIDGNVFWSFTQETRDDNSVEIDSTFSFSGNNAMKFIAAPSDNLGVSKASLAKQKMAFWEGETIRVTAYYFLEGNEELEWLFLMDIEEQTAIGAGPGMRLALVENKLRVEYKFLEDDILQNTDFEKEFPRNKWVKITFQLSLSQKNQGKVKLWQDDELVIDKESQRTLPRDLLYVQQGTKAMYSSVEIGATANSKENSCTLWVDDITIEKIN